MSPKGLGGMYAARPTAVLNDAQRYRKLTSNPCPENGTVTA
jgi:hypothetical protein